MNDLDSSDAPMSVDKSRSFKGAFKVYTVVYRVVYSIPYIACHDAYVSYRKDIADLRKSDQFLGELESERQKIVSQIMRRRGLKESKIKQYLAETKLRKTRK